MLFPVCLSSTNLMTLLSGAALSSVICIGFFEGLYFEGLYEEKYEALIIQADILPKEAARFCLKRLSLPAFCVEACPASG